MHVMRGTPRRPRSLSATVDAEIDYNYTVMIPAESINAAASRGEGETGVTGVDATTTAASVSSAIIGQSVWHALVDCCVQCAYHKADYFAVIGGR